MVIKKNPVIIIVLGLCLTLALITFMGWQLYNNQSLIRQNLDQLNHTEDLRLQLNKDYSDINTLFRIQLFNPSKSNLDQYYFYIDRLMQTMTTAEQYATTNRVLPTYDELKGQLSWLLNAQKNILTYASQKNEVKVKSLLLSNTYRDMESQYAFSIQQLVNAKTSFQYWLALCHDLLLYQNYQINLVYLAITENSGIVSQNYIAYTDHVSRLLSEAIHATNPLIPTQEFKDAQQHFENMQAYNVTIFHLLKNKHQQDAIHLLMSPQYEKEHQAYIGAISEATDQVKVLVYQKIKQANESRVGIAISLVIILCIFILLWFMVVSMLRQWKTYLESTNAKLDLTVEKRTKKLIEEMRANKIAQKEKEKLEDALKQNQKLQAIGVLAAGVAHDFNNLLAIILANSESVTCSDPNDQQAITSITVAAKEAGQLTQQLLTFARKTPQQKTKIDLNQAILDTIQLLTKGIRSDIKVMTLLDSTLPNIQADKSQLSQVLVNLGINAKDAMPQGGEITVATKRVELKEPLPANLSHLKPGAYIELTVSDTGTGIKAKHLEHIFDPFFTTKAVGKGTGLGLATVYGIMAQHKGCITVSSSEQGTTFSLYFPI